MGHSILIFSDTHLTDKPEPKKLAFLLKIITQADQVVINGDFWDSFRTDAKRFSSAPQWQPLFTLLKEKGTIYLYGNHDPIEACAGIENEFSASHGLTHDFKQNGQCFHVEHGHEVKTGKRTESWVPLLLLNAAALFDDILIELGKANLLHRFRAHNMRKRLKREGRWQENTYLICGHSHYPEHLRKNGLYCNSGAIGSKKGSYIVIKDGIPKIHTEAF